MKSFLLLKCKLVSPRVKQEPQNRMLSQATGFGLGDTVLGGRDKKFYYPRVTVCMDRRENPDK